MGGHAFDGMKAAGLPWGPWSGNDEPAVFLEDKNLSQAPGVCLPRSRGSQARHDWPGDAPGPRLASLGTA